MRAAVRFTRTRDLRPEGPEARQDGRRRQAGRIDVLGRRVLLYLRRRGTPLTADRIGRAVGSRGSALAVPLLRLARAGLVRVLDDGLFEAV